MKLHFYALACSLVFGVQIGRAQHGHIDIGAAGTNQNDKLIWANGADFVSESGYVRWLELTNGGIYSNYFQGNITFTVLPATAAGGGPDSRAPAPGARIVGAVTSVSGPAGGEFGFWDTNPASGPKIVVPAGGTNTNTFFISDSTGAPGADPFGHIHGRKMSLSRPGVYKVGFKAFDVSTNGHGGGPIHTSSDELIICFQAGVNLIASNQTNIIYGSIAGRNHILEYSTNLAGTNWTAFATNAGNDHFQAVRDTKAVGPHRFYRQRIVLP
jgi:hypothetical protein